MQRDDIPAPLSFGLARIQELLPHRAPMLLVDHVSELLPGRSIRAHRSFAADEPVFSGHFPERAVLPGVFSIEALAQCAALLAVCSMGADSRERLPCLLSISASHFRRPVFPGEQLDMWVEVVHTSGDVWKFSAAASVDGVPAADAVILATAVPRDSFAAVARQRAAA